MIKQLPKNVIIVKFKDRWTLFCNFFIDSIYNISSLKPSIIITSVSYFVQFPVRYYFKPWTEAIFRILAVVIENWSSFIKSIWKIVGAHEEVSATLKIFFILTDNTSRAEPSKLFIFINWPSRANFLKIRKISHEIDFTANRFNRDDPPAWELKN